MTVAELTIGSGGKRGPRAKDIPAVVTRELGLADLGLLAEQPPMKRNPLQRIRDRHHALARLIAQGRTNTECALITGYCYQTICVLKTDPTFRELVKDYQKIDKDLMADFVDRSTVAAMTAVNILVERMEEDPDSMPNDKLLDIATKLADRAGHAPVQRSVAINASIGFGDRLSEARRRRGLAELEQQASVAIEGEVISES